MSDSIKSEEDSERVKVTVADSPDFKVETSDVIAIVGGVKSRSVLKVNLAPMPPSLLSISKATSSVLPLLAITVTVDSETVASRIEE